jgi:DNA-directed RNA polymerase specialized sigma24 family protein
MGVPSRALFSINPAQSSSAEERSEIDSQAKTIQDEIDQQRSWINRYVQSQLGSDVSAEDLNERIEKRLRARIASNREQLPLADAVKNVTKLLVYEEQRAAYRRSQICLSDANIQSLQDPASLEFAERIDLESQIKTVLDHIPPELLPIVESLYGFTEIEVSRGEMARKLGMPRNRLDKKLSRLFADLRSALGGR